MKRFCYFLLALLLIGFGWQSFISPIVAYVSGASLEENIPSRMIIPSISLDSPIAEVGIRTIEIDGQTYPIWDTAEELVGWHRGSGPPGKKGNTVLAGHSNGGQEIFRSLEELLLGEDIFVETNQGWYQYQVTERFILPEQGQPIEVRQANARWILPTEDERLTLVTCWPYPNSTHRLLVIAYPVSEEPIPDLFTEQQPNSIRQLSPVEAAKPGINHLTPITGQENISIRPSKVTSVKQPPIE